jgi:hypothetical protein
MFTNIAASNSQPLSTDTSEVKSSGVASLTLSEQREVIIEDFLSTLPYETSRVTAICQRKLAKEQGYITGELRNDVIVQEYFRTDKLLPDATEGSIVKDDIPKGVGVSWLTDKSLVQRREIAGTARN